MNAETGCLVCTVQGEEITALCRVWSVGGLQKSLILSSCLGESIGKCEKIGMKQFRISQSFQESIQNTIGQNKRTFLTVVQKSFC